MAHDFLTWNQFSPGYFIQYLPLEEFMQYRKNRAVPSMYWKYTRSQKDVGDIAWDDITRAGAEVGDQRADRVSDTIDVFVGSRASRGFM